jgi:tetratricopeptide (TPR) repeat protein
MSHEYDVFLSYNRDDKVGVERIKHLLEVKYHIRAWLDTWNLIAGQAWMEDIEDALDKCATFAILIGPKGIAGWNNEEMRAAMDIRSRDRSRRVIPVYLPDAPDEKKLPTFLKLLTPVDFRNGKGLEDQDLLYQLHHAIKGLERGETLPDDVNDAELEERLNTGIPTGSYVPFVQNAYFTGRTEVLATLEKGIFNPNVNKPVILSGMGGIGKTQTAVQFAYRYAYRFRGVHWMNLDSLDLLEPRLEAEIAQCGRHMGIALDKHEEQVAETLRRWKSDGPRLVVLDNFEQIDQAHTVLTRLTHANLRILVTSRRSDWHSDIKLELLALNLFQPQEAVSFLRIRLGNDEPEGNLSLLAEKLGYLPLALELAASYIRVAEIPISDYLKELASILEHDSMQAQIFNKLELQTSTKHILDLRATFALSWQKVTDTTQQCIFLMAGHLTPNTPIPKTIFEHALQQKSISINMALRRLYGLNLLTQSQNSEPSIHPLLAEYARGLSKDNIHDPERLLKDALSTLSEEAEDDVFIQDGPAATERALKIDEAAFGPNHPNVAHRLRTLGLELQYLGDLTGSRTAIERALKIDETAFGPNHHLVAKDLDQLGGLLEDMGDLSGARIAYERALKIYEALGPDNFQAAFTFKALGKVLEAIGDLAGALVTYERALKSFESSFGVDHPNVIFSVISLGKVKQAMGDLSGARTTYERALKSDEAAFDHFYFSGVARDFSDLGKCLQAMGDLSGARIAYERALRALEGGPTDDPMTKSVRELLDSLN